LWSAVAGVCGRHRFPTRQHLRPRFSAIRSVGLLLLLLTIPSPFLTIPPPAETDRRPALDRL
jgi:hypothetical protein